jgi:hypothetical protein
MRIDNTRRFPIVAALLCFTCVSSCAAGQNARNCLTYQDVGAIDKYFWGKFPSTDQFVKYAAPDMDLGSNLTSLADVTDKKVPGPESARKLALFLDGYPEYFHPSNGAYSKTFVYWPSHDRNAESMRASSKFPHKRCVASLQYSLERRQCILERRVRAVSFTFLKEEGEVKLGLALVAMDACDGDH